MTGKNFLKDESWGNTKKKKVRLTVLKKKAYDMLRKLTKPFGYSQRCTQR
jgi:hypothetical protein